MADTKSLETLSSWLEKEIEALQTHLRKKPSGFTNTPNNHFTFRFPLSVTDQYPRQIKVNVIQALVVAGSRQMACDAYAEKQKLTQHYFVFLCISSLYRYRIYAGTIT